MQVRGAVRDVAVAHLEELEKASATLQEVADAGSKTAPVEAPAVIVTKENPMLRASQRAKRFAESASVRVFAIKSAASSGPVEDTETVNRASFSARSAVRPGVMDFSAAKSKSRSSLKMAVEI